MSDYIYTLPSGTELSVEAALGDLDRISELLLRPEPWGDDGLAADLIHVRELLVILDARPDRPDPELKPTGYRKSAYDRRQPGHWPDPTG